MFNNDFYLEFIERYEEWYNEDPKERNIDEKEQQKLLNEFLNRFTLAKVGNMEIDEYVIGKSEKDSFCYWVEKALKWHGDIAGGQLTAFQRFGVYFDKELSQYVIKNKKAKKTKFGDSYLEVFTNVRAEIIKLINDTINGNVDGVANNKLNPLFKNKISYLYDSLNQVPIYGENDIDALLTLFGVSFNHKEDRVYKRVKLFKIYKELNHPLMTPYKFMRFIYSSYGYKSYIRTGDIACLKNPIKTKKYRLVDVKTTSEILTKNKITKVGLVKSETSETLKQKRVTGKKGEMIVGEYLEKHREELGIVGKIDRACEYNDYAHYDYAYVDNLGKRIYIEVKSTKANRDGIVDFDMSAQEYEFMIQHRSTYFIYYINDVYNGDIIQRISADLVIGKPSKYKMTFNINE